MSQIRLRIVGESVIELDSKRITPTSPQMFALLLFLGTECDREVPRSQLIDLLYPASEPSGHSSHRLRQLLYKLRGMGAPFVFGDGTVMVAAKHVRNEVTELLSASSEVRRERVARSFEVLPLYMPPTDSSLSEWVEQLREKLHSALRQQLIRDIEVARQKADWRYVEAMARRTLELDPLNESAVLALAEATARTGSKARAVSILDAYRAELGETRSHLALPAALLEKRINASHTHLPSGRRDPLPLIGRERELESLLSQWQSARSGSAHLLWLTGNESVGKSRVAEELAASVQLRGSGQVVTFSMSPMDADRPFSLAAALANHLSLLPGAAGCDPTSLQALGKLSGTIVLPNAINPDNRNSTYLDLAVRNALCDLVSCVADERSVLVLIDDAQHIDDASAELVSALLSRVADKRVLLVLCSPHCPASRSVHVGELHIEPLTQRSSQELWQSLLEAYGAQLPEAVSQKCVDTAGGNPGHLELLAQQATQDPEHFLIPVDLITLADRRLGQLTVEARYVLEAIVVLDDMATARSVAYLAGLPTYDLLATLHTLESRDLIENTPSGLRCRSGLIADRVRATSLGAAGTVLEVRAAEYLEKEQSGERWSPSIAWRIASHWQRSGEPRRARAYFRACWQHAVSIGQPTTACEAINEALGGSSNPEDRASLLDDLIGALQAAGNTRGVSGAVRERRLLGTRVHDSPTRSAQLAFDEDEANWAFNSNPELSISSFERHLASSTLNTHRRIRAARILMMAADGDLEPSLASSTIGQCQKLTAENSHSALLLRYVYLIYHTIFGDADLALRIADEIQEETKTVERSWYALTFERNCAFARQLVGAGPTDYESFERGFANALEASMTPVALWFAGSLMSVLVDDSDFVGARRWMRTAEQLAESFAPEDWPIDYLGAQIDLSLISGDYLKAKRYLDIIANCSHFQSKRVRNDLYIYRLRVSQFSGEPWIPESHLEYLLQHHEIGKRLTRHDDHMEVLWQTLVAAGQAQRASDLLADYLRSHRRERRPCRHMLVERTRSDGAWGGPGRE